MNELTPTDMQYVLSRLPRDVLKLVKEQGIVLGGGFIREVIAGNKPNDIDLFGRDKQVIDLLAGQLAECRNARIHRTTNAITIISPPRIPVQFITRWLYSEPQDIADSFDFTVCMAVIWYDGCFKSCIHPDFYVDLAARRLVYTHPHREEAAGGSIMRVRKFLARGYSVQAHSLAGVISRLVMGVDEVKEVISEERLAFVLKGLLHEVDPLLVIDGIEARDEHAEF